MDFVEICNVCTRKVIIKAAKRIFNSDKICRRYCDFYFGVTFFGTHCSYHCVGVVVLVTTTTAITTITAITSAKNIQE